MSGLTACWETFKANETKRWQPEDDGCEYKVAQLCCVSSTFATTIFAAAFGGAYAAGSVTAAELAKPAGTAAAISCGLTMLGEMPAVIQAARQTECLVFSAPRSENMSRENPDYSIKRVTPESTAMSRDSIRSSFAI